MVSGQKLKVLRRYSHWTEGTRLSAADKAIQETIETRISRRRRILRHAGEIGNGDTQRAGDLFDLVIFRKIIAAQIMTESAPIDSRAPRDLGSSKFFLIHEIPHPVDNFFHEIILPF